VARLVGLALRLVVSRCQPAIQGKSSHIGLAGIDDTNVGSDMTREGWRGRLFEHR